MTIHLTEPNKSGLQTTSADLAQDNLLRLKELLPEVVTERADGPSINLEVLETLCGVLSATDSDEKFGLSWHGKRRARQLALAPSAATLRPSLEDSVAWDTTQNLMIEGDNLEVLKLLQKSYTGKVKLIYIDPPYNTGKDFVYPDDWQDTIRNYHELTGQIAGGRKVSSNTEASGRFHTAWLNMMYPRLKLARNLLSYDGVIAISIDDGEARNLRLMCDEIFSEDCFVAQIVVQSNKGGQDYLALAKTHEYVVVYSKTEACEDALQELPRAIASSSIGDDRGAYEPRELRNRNPKFHRGNRPNLFYPFYINPDNVDANGYAAVSTEPGSGFTLEAHPRNSRGEDGCWRWGKPKSAAAIIVGDPAGSQIVAKQTRAGGWNVYEKCRLTTEKAKTIWDESEVRTEAGTRTVRELLSSGVFDHPKPVELIRKLVQIGCGEGVVLDFFAGSGTTAHAVMMQNALDHGDRRYILVQLPEPLAPEVAEQKAAADFCDTLKLPRSIVELTKERLRRAAARLKLENPLFGGDLGFRVFKLDSSNIGAWDPACADLPRTLIDSAEHIKAGRSEMDVVYELLLKLGVDLCVPIEQKEVGKIGLHSVGGGVLLVCLADSIPHEQIEPLALGIAAWHDSLSPTGETTCVFRDSGFADDEDKTNMVAILQQRGLGNVRSL